jgi:hypothetical protein
MNIPLPLLVLTQSKNTVKGYILWLPEIQRKEHVEVPSKRVYSLCAVLISALQWLKTLGCVKVLNRTH